MWRHHAEAGPPRADAIALRVGTLTSHLAKTVRAIEDAVGRVGSPASVAVSGCAPLGTLRAHVLSVGAQDGAALVARVREGVAPVEGSVVVEDASAALRGAVDPWGPVAPDVLALMRAVKQQFDPDGILNSGRFVGGL
jgi:glycolate oxidase FAD binding subunit